MIVMIGLIKQLKKQWQCLELLSYFTTFFGEKNARVQTLEHRYNRGCFSSKLGKPFSRDVDVCFPLHHIEKSVQLPTFCPENDLT
jgi:hypothetical protein